MKATQQGNPCFCIPDVCLGATSGKNKIISEMSIAFLRLELSPAFPKTVKARCPVNWFSSLSVALCPHRKGLSLNPASPPPRVSLRCGPGLLHPLRSREGEHSRGEGRAPCPDLGRSPRAPGDGTEGPFPNIRPGTATFHPRDLSL